MNNPDAFERILASLYEAMLDDAHWPATSAMIGEACGITGNALLLRARREEGRRQLGGHVEASLVRLRVQRYRSHYTNQAAEGVENGRAN